MVWKYSLFVVALFAGCVSTDYIGKTYPPTSHVDIFLSEQDIKGEYEIMGEISAQTEDNNMFVNAEKMQEKIMEEAKAKGADAIILHSLERYVTGEETSTSAETKSDRNKTTTKEKSETNVKQKKELKATLIKFKR